MRHLARFLVCTIAAVLVLQLPIGQATGLASATESVCNDPTPFLHLPSDDGASTAVTDPAVIAATAERKRNSPNDPEAANRDLSTGAPGANAARRAEKLALVLSGGARGASVSRFADRQTMVELCGQRLHAHSAMDDVRVALSRFVSTASGASGPGYAWVDNLNQQGQQTPYWCGPATLSETATTMANNGRLTNPVNQSTGASSMGTTANGTDVSAMVNGLNAWVGQPVAQTNWYAFVWVSMSATSAESNTFLDNVNFDALYGWPVTGDAWEEHNGPHLVGHPNLTDPIFHWFEIGGYGSYGSSIYYADSATSVWSGVQQYSWYDRNTLVQILGGMGYAW
jgi:hypothetical protein